MRRLGPERSSRSSSGSSPPPLEGPERSGSSPPDGPLRSSWPSSSRSGSEGPLREPALRSSSPLSWSSSRSPAWRCGRGGGAALAAPPAGSGVRTAGADDGHAARRGRVARGRAPPPPGPLGARRSPRRAACGPAVRFCTSAGPATAPPASTTTVPAFASAADAPAPPAPADSSAIRAAQLAARPARQPGHERQRHDRGRGRPQRRARPVHELAHRAGAQPELAGDLVLAAALDRDRQQRLALARRQRREPLQRLAHDGAALELVVGRVGDLQRLLDLLVVVAGLAQQVQARVVRDPVQPRPQLAHLVAALAARARRPRASAGGRPRRAPRAAPAGTRAAAGAGSAPRSPRRRARGRRGRARRAACRTACGGGRSTETASRHPGDTPGVPEVTQASPGMAQPVGSGSSSRPCSAASRTAGICSTLRSNSSGV